MPRTHGILASSQCVTTIHVAGAAAIAIEIERKFLLNNDDWRRYVRASEYLAQGYLGGSRSSVRVRIGGERAWLNIKSQALGTTRLEFEYEIPRADADVMLRELAEGPVVSKTRHYVDVGAHVFEIDEFDADNAGLVVAEVELSDAAEAFISPPWLGQEVTDDRRYYNVNLAKNPYRHWEAR